MERLKGSDQNLQETFEREVKSWKQEEVEARNCMDENEVQLM